MPEGLVSGLAILLLRKWSLGEISAPTVQEISAAAEKAGVSSSDVSKLAKLGGSGNSQQNAQRDLQCSFFQKPCKPRAFSGQNYCEDQRRQWTT